MVLLSFTKSIEVTTFFGRDIIEVLSEVNKWLAQRKDGVRENHFYFIQMVQTYDNELGYIIDIYHGEIK